MVIDREKVTFSTTALSFDTTSPAIRGLCQRSTRRISSQGLYREPDTSATRHFGIKTLWDTSAPQNWCRSLRRITGGAVSHRNCPGSKCPGFSSITALVSKCLVAEVSGNPYIARNHRPWATSLPLTVYTHLRVFQINHALKPDHPC